MCVVLICLIMNTPHSNHMLIVALVNMLDNFNFVCSLLGRLCGLVVRVLATDPEVPGSIHGAARFSEK
jgi:hypothetical protein